MLYLFNSYEFLLFFLGVFVLYWVLPHGYRNPLLLLSSYVFYASWDIRLLGLLIGMTAVNFFLAQKIERFGKPLLIGLVAFNVGILGVFKYFDFFVSGFSSLLSTFGLSVSLPTLMLLLPIGISFYTFQLISYVVDVYKKHVSPSRNLIVFFLYIAFFAQLVAGPIERAGRMFSEYTRAKHFRQTNFRTGTYLLVYGLFCKVVLADSLAVIVENVYGSQTVSGTAVLLATYAFALQIYLDFLGYSNMARGIAHFFGITLSTNFSLPYLSSNVAEFWRRWHITLSYWVRDYVYVPLGGNKTMALGLLPLFVSWLVMGLWHGAAWHFVLWGLYWFVAIYVYRLISKRFRSMPSVLGIVITFHVAVIGWIFFRAESVSHALTLFASLSTVSFSSLISAEYAVLYIAALFVFVYEAVFVRKFGECFVSSRGFYSQLLFYLVLFVLYINLGATANAEFVYFQF